jgi:predicted HNH restriction endonuclease
MQKCTDCSIDITEETGYKKSNTKWQSKCKSCFNKYCIERWKDRKVKAIEYKGGQCKNCGYNKYYGALEFHHTEPSQKEADWNKIRLWSWEKIKLELDKCDLLCSNCHKEIHMAP